MGALQEVFASFGIEFDTKALDAGQGKIDGVIKGFQALGAAIAGNAVFGAVRDFAAGFMEQAGTIEKGANALGLTTDQYQEMAYAARQADVDVEEFNATMMQFSKVAHQALTGKGQAASVFRELGISARDSEGNLRNVIDVYDDVADRLSVMADEERRNRILEMIGVRGTAARAMFTQGADERRQFRAEAREWGGLTEGSIAASGRLETQTKRVGLAVDALKSALAVELLPKLADLVEKGMKAAKVFVTLIKNTTILDTALKVVGAAALVFGLKMALANLPLILMTLGLLALVVVLDDLSAAWNGQPSQIAKWVDSFFGVGTAVGWVEALKGTIDEIPGVVDSAAVSAEEFLLDFSMGFTMAWRTISRFLDDIAFDTQDLFSSMGAWFGDTWDTIKTMLANGLMSMGGLLAQAGRMLGLTSLQHAGEAMAGSGAEMSAGAAVSTANRASEQQGRRDARLNIRDRRDAEDRALVDERAAEQQRLDDMRASISRASAAIQPRAAVRPAGSAGGTTNNRTSNTTVNINGARDPAAVAREVQRVMAARERARRDADHPQPGGEG